MISDSLLILMTCVYACNDEDENLIDDEVVTHLERQRGVKSTRIDTTAATAADSDGIFSSPG
jgi:hypothetical protein